MRKLSTLVLSLFVISVCVHAQRRGYPIRPYDIPSTRYIGVQNVSISGGVLTIGNYTYYKFDTEGGAPSDDIDTITGGRGTAC